MLRFLHSIPIGETAIGYRIEIIAHESNKTVDAYSQVIEKQTTFKSEHESFVERIGEDEWLIDGELYQNFCQEPCHP